MNDKDLLQLKKEYNKIIKRLNKAHEFWGSCSDEQYNDSLGLYQSLIIEGSKLCQELEKALNRPLTHAECLNGIDI